MLQNLTQDVHLRTHAHAMPPIGAIGLAIAVSIAYLLAARFGLVLLAIPDDVAFFCPAACLACGLLIALGRRARLPVAAGVIVATVITNLMGDRNVWTASAFAFINAGEVLFTAWLIERLFGSPLSLDRLRNVLGLLAAAAMATAVSGIGAVVTFKVLHSPTPSIWATWRHWSASDAVGIITVAPLVIGLAEALREPPPRSEIIEGVMALVALVVMIVIITISLPPQPSQTLRPGALVFPIMLWLTTRCRPLFAAAAAFIVSVAVAWAITCGVGHLGDSTLPIDERVPGEQVAILGFALCAYVLAALFAERRQAQARQALVIAELDHRVKNVLARVAAVVRHARRHSGNTDELAKVLDGRIQSIAGAHALLSESRWSAVRLDDLIRHQLTPYTTEANTQIGGADVMLTSAQTQAIAVVIHELVTNAVKYGALSNPDGRVSVSWCADMATVLTITWREIGGPRIVHPVRSGYGSGLICDLIPHELGGTVELAFLLEGVCCKIEIPLKRRVRSGCQSSLLPNRLYQWRTRLSR
jgi:two-component sensor histidine kinase/integral membrane sensor domain MASE1